jgi:hypothetical protein
MVLPLSDKANPFYAIDHKNIFSSKRPSLAYDGNTIMNSPCLTTAFIKAFYF